MVWTCYKSNKFHFHSFTGWGPQKLPISLPNGQKSPVWIGFLIFYRLGYPRAWNRISEFSFPEVLHSLQEDFVIILLPFQTHEIHIDAVSFDVIQMRPSFDILVFWSTLFWYVETVNSLNLRYFGSPFIINRVDSQPNFKARFGTVLSLLSR